MSKDKDKPAKTNSKALELKGTMGQTLGQVIAEAALMPAINAAYVVETYQGNILGKDADMNVLVEQLSGTFEEVKGGDLHTLEAMLISQAMALQTIFTSLARRAHSAQYLKHIESVLGLALKAQAQSRATISALVDLKFPRQVMFTKQANIANGPQQINNGVNAKSQTVRSGTRARTKEKQNSTNKLSGETHELLQDSRTSGTTIEGNSDLAAVGKVNRTKVRRG